MQTLTVLDCKLHVRGWEELPYFVLVACPQLPFRTLGARGCLRGTPFVSGYTSQLEDFVEARLGVSGSYGIRWNAMPDLAS